MYYIQMSNYIQWYSKCKVIAKKGKTTDQS